MFDEGKYFIVGLLIGAALVTIFFTMFVPILTQPTETITSTQILQTQLAPTNPYTDLAPKFQDVIDACKQACRDTTIVCPATQLCQQKNLNIAYPKLNYSFNEATKTVTVTGVDAVAALYGFSMEPLLNDGYNYMYVKYVSKSQLKPNMVITYKTGVFGTERTTHAISGIYPDYVVTYGINNGVGINEERVKYEDILYILANI